MQHRRNPPPTPRLPRHRLRLRLCGRNARRTEPRHRSSSHPLRESVQSGCVVGLCSSRWRVQDYVRISTSWIILRGICRRHSSCCVSMPMMIARLLGLVRNLGLQLIRLSLCWLGLGSWGLMLLVSVFMLVCSTTLLLPLHVPG